MRTPGSLIAMVAIAGCGAPRSTYLPIGDEESVVSSTSDDGTFLEQIDPLGGQWRVERLGGEDFTRFNGWIVFEAGGFLNHGADCSGGYPAFYRLDGESIAITRLEPVRVGKCAGTPELANSIAAQRRAAIDSERTLAGFIDQLVGWKRDGPALTLTARDGTMALLTRPKEPNPDIAGRWLIQTIGGEALITEQRPAMLSISRGTIGAQADCNSFGTSFSVPEPGRMVIAGPIVSTLIGCGPEDAAEDDLIDRAIASATSYRFDGDKLFLNGQPGLEARRPPAPDRRLAGEYEHCGNTLLGAYHSGPVALSIDAASMRDSAGCVASYSANGPELTLRLGSAPACSRSSPEFVPGQPVEIGGDISVLAVTRPDGFGFRDDGVLVLRTQRGLLNMCRKGARKPYSGLPGESTSRQ